MLEGQKRWVEDGRRNLVPANRSMGTLLRKEKLNEECRRGGSRDFELHGQEGSINETTGLEM